MNTIILFIFLNVFNFSLTYNCQGDTSTSFIRGHYRDVLSEQNGGLLENARQIYLFGNGDQKSPLRNNLYFSQVYFGHARCDRNEFMIFPSTQAYQINTIRIRFWNYDTRIHNFEVYCDEVKIYEGFAQGVVIIKFSDRIVQKVRIKSLGNSIDGYMSILKVQAFYQLWEMSI
ncbi:unnamed protein product [Paramecium primaurelia]|uniref:Uncharacterized protein n=1 Tax=Paramecium primaurelia TaxID=5886 RepID=A0A8S1NTC0_PARPR|nr:unnamed protein product [Paramecium primaurelia]CAD8094670.1 unnamed protein product [Paramecium primaurelia]